MHLQKYHYHAINRVLRYRVSVKLEAQLPELELTQQG